VTGVLGDGREDCLLALRLPSLGRRVSRVNGAETWRTSEFRSRDIGLAVGGSGSLANMTAIVVV
jgi:hypothetical protein